MLASVLMLCAVARAQELVDVESTVADVDLQQFHHAVDSQRFMQVDESRPAYTTYVSGRFGLNYLNDPAVFRWSDGDKYRAMAHGVEANLIAFTWIGPVRVGIDQPVWLLARSSEGAVGRGVGSSALDVKLTAVDARKRPFGLAFGGRVNVGSFGGDERLGGQQLLLSAIADGDVGPVRVAANYGRGWDVHAPVIDGQPLMQQQVFRLGAAWGIADDEALGVSAEVVGHRYQQVLSEFIDDPVVAFPIEALAGGWIRPLERRAWRFNAGLGTGLNGQFGAARLRVVAGVSWDPSRDPDLDHDGHLNVLDACRNRPEDEDGWRDRDGCPDESYVVPLRVDGMADKLPEGLRCTFDSPLQTLEVVDVTKVELHPADWTVRCRAPDYEPTELLLLTDDVRPGRPLVLSMVPTFGRIDLEVTDLAGNRLDATAHFADGTTLEVPGGQLTFSLDDGRHLFSVGATGHHALSVPLVVDGGNDHTVLVELDEALASRNEVGIELSRPLVWVGATAQLSPESAYVLYDVANQLAVDPMARELWVRVSTNDRPDDRQNLQLAQARADTIVAILVSRGVPLERLHAMSLAPARDHTQLLWAE